MSRALIRAERNNVTIHLHEVPQCTMFRIAADVCDMLDLTDIEGVRVMSQFPSAIGVTYEGSAIDDGRVSRAVQVALSGRGVRFEVSS